jgi:hypothetical protein
VALATVADVKRVLKNASIPDADLVPYLEDATEWVERVYGRDWDASGAQTETFYNVRQGAIVALKDESPTSITVTGYGAPGSAGTVLVENTGYMVMSRGRIQLAFIRSASLPLTGVRPEELEAVPPYTWSRLVVAYTASGVVPAPVREAVALIAAASYRQSEDDVSGIKSERLGDYSYSRGEGSEVVVPKRARTRLAPYSGRRRVRSV